MSGHLLDEAIAPTTTVVVLLQLHKLELAKGLEDVLKILLSDAEVDVSHVQSVEGDRVGVISRRLRVAHLAILLSLGELDNDGDT
jgi:hypothetical protein